MILVDTSVWIELLNGRLGKTVTADDLLQLVTCGPIVPGDVAATALCGR